MASPARGRRQLHARVRQRVHDSTNKATQRGINLPVRICTPSSEQATTRADHPTNSFLTPHNTIARPRVSGVIIDDRPLNPDHVDTADLVCKMLHTSTIKQHELDRIQHRKRSRANDIGVALDEHRLPGFEIGKPSRRDFKQYSGDYGIGDTLGWRWLHGTRALNPSLC